MAARKTTKPAAKKKAPAKKKAGTGTKKESASSAKKPRKTASARAGRAARKPAAGGAARKAPKASSRATTRKDAPAAAGAAAPEPKAKPTRSPAAQGGVSAAAVNLGHVFALRPRESTSFRQQDFLAARRLLQDESFGSLEEAARAVARRALALTHDVKGRPGGRPGH